jgi:hypothetical protein
MGGKQQQHNFRVDWRCHPGDYAVRGRPAPDADGQREQQSRHKAVTATAADITIAGFFANIPWEDGNG